MEEKIFLISNRSLYHIYFNGKDEEIFNRASIHGCEKINKIKNYN